MLVWERNGKNAESDVTYSSEGIILQKNSELGFIKLYGTEKN